MKKLTELVDVLSSLKKVSKTILKNMLPLMKILMVDNNDMVEEVSHRTDAPKNIASEYLQTVSLAIIADAEIIKKEVDAFAEVVELSQKDLKKNIKKFPFLAEAWFGDTFNNVSGVDALKILLEDLKKEEIKTNEDWLIENAVDILAVDYLKSNQK